MGIVINTNVAQMHSTRKLHSLEKSAETTSNRLSHGKKVLKGADDIAALSIDDKVVAKMRSAQAASRNNIQGISAIEQAGSSINNLYGLSIRMKELATQAASDVFSDTERSLSNMEVQELKQEMDRIIDTAEFNGHGIFKDGGVRLDFQIGVNSTEENDQIKFDTTGLDMSTQGLGIKSIAVDSKESARNALGALDKSMNVISSFMADIGSLQNRMGSITSTLGVSVENMGNTHSVLRDTDYAEEASNQARISLEQDAATAFRGQTTNISQLALNLIE